MHIRGQSFQRGIGMHSQARLTYELTESFSKFVAAIGIDDAAGDLGNAVFRVLADGKEVFNSGQVTGKDQPRPIIVPLAGAKKLTLCVDYGENLDIGDQANWADARLIK